MKALSKCAMAHLAGYLLLSEDFLRGWNNKRCPRCRRSLAGRGCDYQFGMVWSCTGCGYLFRVVFLEGGAALMRFGDRHETE
jgi:hypothetical protein